VQESRNPHLTGAVAAQPTSSAAGAANPKARRRKKR